jgi:hypothetical protein
MPGIRDVQLAGWFTKTGDRQNRRDLFPGNLFPARRHQVRQELVQAQQPPKSQRQPDVAEVAQPLKTNTFEFDQHRLVVARLVVRRRVKQRRLRPGSAIQSVAESSPAIPLALFQFAEIGHHPVSRALRRAD